MDESEALQEESAGVATPIFNVYRRGYDPDQVDRYVADQQRRLDEMQHRASESERKLAAAVGQLRELHRRVAVYESEARNAQPPALDTLGERVQRILQEAWEGAYNLRQEAEREVAELRETVHAEVDSQREQIALEVAAQREQVAIDVEELRQVASREAADLVDEATRRALAIRDEMDRRRQNYLEKVERDRQRAVSQIAFLYDQRQMAISELVRLQATVQATVEEMVHSPLARPASALGDAAAARESADSAPEEELTIDTLEALVPLAAAVPPPVIEAEPHTEVVDSYDVEPVLAAGPEGGAELEDDLVAGETVDQVGSATEAYAEPGTEAYAEPAGSYAEPGTESYAEPGAEGYAEPGTQAYAETDTGSYAEPLAEPLAEPERPTPGSLFEEIMDEPTGPIEAGFDEGPAPWDRITPSGDIMPASYPSEGPSYGHYEGEVGSSAVADDLSAHDIPTGPMEAVSYGEESAEVEEPSPAIESEVVADEPRRGVFDAEAEGWA